MESNSTQEQSNNEIKDKNVKQNIEKVQETCEQTLFKIQQCMKQLNETLKDIDTTTNKIDKFKEDFGNALNSLAQKITQNMQSFQRHKNPEEVKSNCSVQDAANLIKSKQNIVFLTGAGISVASGMPTFRGQGGFWTKDNNQYEAQKVATNEFFQNSNELYWQWHADFLGLVRKFKPNQNHIQIANLQKYYRTQPDKKFTLVTQNIDGYHIKALEQVYGQHQQNVQTLFEYQNLNNENYGFCPEIFEIHGNMNYLRCEKNCQKHMLKYINTINKQDKSLICANCGSKLRPQILFFDEAYCEQFYRSETVNQKCSDMQCLVVVGTMLETSYSANLVGKAVQSGIEIIEINPQPVINYEKILTLKNKAEDVIPQLCQLILQNQQQVNQKSIIMQQQEESKQNKQQIPIKSSKQTQFNKNIQQKKTKEIVQTITLAKQKQPEKKQVASTQKNQLQKNLKKSGQK